MITRQDTLKLLDQVAPAAFQAFGTRQQMVKTIEECGELIQVLAKKINLSPITDVLIIDEVADVLIMANQMRYYFGPETVDLRMNYKLTRTANTILGLKRPPPSEL